MSNVKIIAVVDAASVQGLPVVRGLLKQGYLVRALVRDKDTNTAREIATYQGVKLRIVDYNDQKSVTKAFSGVWGVYAYTHFFLAMNEMYLEERQGKIMVDSAIECGVKVFIWNSSPNARSITNNTLQLPELTDHARVEEYIRSKGDIDTKFVFVYLGLFVQNLTKGVFGVFIDYDNNVIENSPVPLDDDVQLPVLDADDLGIIVPAIFNKSDVLAGKRIPVFSDVKTLPEILAVIGRSAERSFRFKSIDVKNYFNIMHDLSLENFFRFLNGYGWYGGIFKKEDLNLIKEICPNLRDVDGWLKKTGTAWLQEAKELRPVTTRKGATEVHI